jgi:hypothetical protein
MSALDSLQQRLEEMDMDASFAARDAERKLL